MIRQAISCDVCGAEKRQTNHWFVACEQAGELRVSGWSSRLRQRPGTKHLCGQTCLHKLVDEFMARTIDARPSSTPAEPPAIARAHSEADTSLTSPRAFQPPAPTPKISIAAPPPPRAAAETPISAVVPFPTRPVESALPPQPESAPQYAPRRWRAEAWERERNRELRSSETHARHKSI